MGKLKRGPRCVSQAIFSCYFQRIGFCTPDRQAAGRSVFKNSQQLAIVTAGDNAIGEHLVLFIRLSSAPLVTLAAIAGVIVGGRYLTGPMFNYIAARLAMIVVLLAESRGWRRGNARATTLASFSS